LIDGGLDVLSGVVKVFVPPDSACYECTLDEDDYRLLPRRTSCGLFAREMEGRGAVPTTPISAAVVGALQVQEALKLLHPDAPGRRLRGEGYLFDGLAFEPMLMQYTRKADEDCGSHDVYDQVLPLPGSRRDWSVGRLAEWALREHGLTPTYLSLERDVLTALCCVQCENEERINRPLALYRGDPGACPRCGSDNRRAVWRGGVEVTAAPETSVFDLGVPPMDVLTLRAGSVHLRVTFAGDRPELLPDRFFAEA
jgi:adenylyltransferase/sulfurtransferase